MKSYTINISEELVEKLVSIYKKNGTNWVQSIESAINCYLDKIEEDNQTKKK